MHQEHVQREKQEAQRDRRNAIEAKLAQMQSAAAQASFSKIKWRSSSLVETAPTTTGGVAVTASSAASHDTAFSFLCGGDKAAAGPGAAVAAARARGRATTGHDHPVSAFHNGGDGDRAAVSFSKIRWRASPFAGGDTVGGAALGALRPTASLPTNAKEHGTTTSAVSYDSGERPQTDEQACGQADEHRRPGVLSKRAQSLLGQLCQLPVPRQQNFDSLCFEDVDEVSDDALDASTSTRSATSKLAHDSKGLPMWGRTRPPHAEAPSAEARSAKGTKGYRGDFSDHDDSGESDGESMSESEASTCSAISKLDHDSKGLPMWGRACGNLARCDAP